MPSWNYRNRLMKRMPQTNPFTAPANPSSPRHSHGLSPIKPHLQEFVRTVSTDRCPPRSNPPRPLSTGGNSLRRRRQKIGWKKKLKNPLAKPEEGCVFRLLTGRLPLPARTVSITHILSVWTAHLDRRRQRRQSVSRKRLASRDLFAFGLCHCVRVSLPRQLEPYGTVGSLQTVATFRLLPVETARWDSDLLGRGE